MIHSIMGVERLHMDLRVLYCMRNLIILNKEVFFIVSCKNLKFRVNPHPIERSLGCTSGRRYQGSLGDASGHGEVLLLVTSVTGVSFSNPRGCGSAVQPYRA